MPIIVWKAPVNVAMEHHMCNHAMGMVSMAVECSMVEHNYSFFNVFYRVSKIALEVQVRWNHFTAFCKQAGWSSL